MRRLLIRPGGIGDFVLSLPAMECLRAEYTEIWAAGQNLPLARLAARTDSIVSSGLDALGLPERPAPARLIERLRGFDSIVSWYGAGRPEFRQAALTLGLPFRFLPALPAAAAGVHAADFYLDQARTISQCQGDAIPRIDCPRCDEGYAVIHPFSGSSKKNWPLDRYRELARRLEAHLPVYWCAGPAEILDGAVRYADLYQLACWLARGRLYIGNDSGITHLAAAAGVPVVAVFGPTDPAVWAPRGERVRIVATGRPGEPAANIGVEEVAAAAFSV